MRIYYAQKTGRGKYCSCYGRGRSVHHMKRGGSLLLMPGLGASNGGVNQGMSGLGVSQTSEQKDAQEKVPMHNIMQKLQKIHLKDGVKRKNVSFMV